MGGLWIEANTGKIYQVSWFAQSDTKWLLEILTDAPFLPVCADVFGLNLTPLRKIETDWYNVNLGSLIWPSPQTVIECVQSLIAAFNNTPNAFAILETERQQRGLDFLNLSGFEDEEVTSSFIQDELLGIAQAAELAQQEGAVNIKLCGS